MSHCLQEIKTYIGNYGYSINKSFFKDTDFEKVKKELTFKPFSPMASVKTVPFPIYRENPARTKMYVPLYYGIKNYGHPDANHLTKGDEMSTNCVFVGTLKEYQEPVLVMYLQNATQSDIPYSGLLELHCGWGKTAGAIYIASVLRRKTLVIVHKSDLLDQWVERIRQFMPNARIGQIQGQIFDVENKDIVLCMLQTLIQKPFPLGTFNQFGFTIIDEVHHISSKSFSDALFRVVSFYMIGISATMKRKDNATDVFKMFLGEILVSVKQHSTKNDVIIHKMKFEAPYDNEYNEIIQGYNGDVQNSSMISKICSYVPRTEYILEQLWKFIRKPNILDADFKAYYERNILTQRRNCLKCNTFIFTVENYCCGTINYCLACNERIIEHSAECRQIVSKYNKCVKEGWAVSEAKKHTVPKCLYCHKRLKYRQHYIPNPLIEENNSLQTLCLAHNLNLLEYMYHKMVNMNYCNVSYYVGGMSKEELDYAVSNAQVLLATYTMASEGTDIPSVNAEFLMTPRSDVEQPTGRALRKKHNRSVHIVDFVDTHEPFVKQWYKRRAFFKRMNYRIVEGMQNDQKTKEKDVLSDDEDGGNDEDTKTNDNCILDFE
jgi:superfamily II DNA or RNA helicase